MSSGIPSVTVQRNSDKIQPPVPDAGIDVRSIGKERELRGSDVSAENKSQLSRSYRAESLAKVTGALQLNSESKKRITCEGHIATVFETVNWTAVLSSLQVSIEEIFQKQSWTATERCDQYSEILI
jgi:hypothetical protein